MKGSLTYQELVPLPLMSLRLIRLKFQLDRIPRHISRK